MRQPLSLKKCRIQTDKPLAPQIYDFLRRQIVNTEIKPGTAFSENELSQHFEVSRQPVREALMRLRVEGLLAVYPQRSNVVQKISVSNLKQICFIRTAIETASLLNADKLAAAERGQVLAALEQNLQEQHQLDGRDCTDQEGQIFLEKDDEFHRLICSLSGGPMAWNTVQSIKGQMDRIRYLSNESVSPVPVLIAEHEQIGSLLKEGSLTAAAEQLRRHLSEILATYIPIRRAHTQWFLPEDEDVL